MSILTAEQLTQAREELAILSQVVPGTVDLVIGDQYQARLIEDRYGMPVWELVR